MNESKREENIQRLNGLIHACRVVMLTTLNTQDGSLHSRPMVTQVTPFDGSLWFFSRAATEKVDEIRAGSQVNLSYSLPEQGIFVSVSGAAYVLRDRMSMETQWDERHRAWFPNGLDEPDLVLLRVDAHEAEIWDATRRVNGEALKFL